MQFHKLVEPVFETVGTAAAFRDECHSVNKAEQKLQGRMVMPQLPESSHRRDEVVVDHVRDVKVASGDVLLDVVKHCGSRP